MNAPMQHTALIPLTGKEYLESLQDDREVWIYGERVKNIVEHPAFRNSARMVARFYDALHDPARREVLTAPTEWGGYTHKFFQAPRTVADQVASRDAIAESQRISYGWMGRSPDYKAAFLATLGANPDFYDPFKDNALKWYKKVNDEVTFVNHAIVNPPVDRNKQLEEVRDVYMHVEKETDGVISVASCAPPTSFRTSTRRLNVSYGLLRPCQLTPPNAPISIAVSSSGSLSTAASLTSPERLKRAPTIGPKSKSMPLDEGPMTSR